MTIWPQKAATAQKKRGCAVAQPHRNIQSVFLISNLIGQYGNQACYAYSYGCSLCHSVASAVVMNHGRGRRTMMAHYHGGGVAMVVYHCGLVMYCHMLVVGRGSGIVLHNGSRLVVRFVHMLHNIVALFATVMINLYAIICSSIVSVVLCKTLCRHKHSAYNHCDNHQLFHNTCFFKVIHSNTCCVLVWCKYITGFSPLQR